MSERPGIDHLRVGDVVTIVEPIYRREPRLTLARITSQKRVWWEFEEAEPGTYSDGLPRRPRTWRMRRDTQDIASGYSSCDRFATAEQLQWEDRRRLADNYLRKIRVDTHSCWIPELNDLTLANLIRTHLGLEPF